MTLDDRERAGGHAPCTSTLRRSPIVALFPLICMSSRPVLASPRSTPAMPSIADYLQRTVAVGCIALSVSRRGRSIHCSGVLTVVSSPLSTQPRSLATALDAADLGTGGS